MSCVQGDRLRTCMSSVIRRRRGVMGSLLVGIEWDVARGSASILPQRRPRGNSGPGTGAMWEGPGGRRSYGPPVARSGSVQRRLVGQVDHHLAKQYRPVIYDKRIASLPNLSTRVSDVPNGCWTPLGDPLPIHLNLEARPRVKPF